MGRSTQLITDGRVVGYECEHGHQHESAAKAMACDPDVFAEAKTAEQKAAKAQTVEQIKADPNFTKALAAAKQLGAATDEDAEAVVFKNGISTVLKIAAERQLLGIPKPAVPKPPTPPVKPTT
jgi:precorrin-3B methylase